MASFTYGEKHQYWQLLNSEGDAGEGRMLTPQYKRTPLTHVQHTNFPPARNMPLCLEPVEPLDIEAHIQNQLADPELEPFQYLMDYPNDDVEVTLSSREYQTTTPAEPDNWENMTPQVRACVQTYTKDWLMVTRSYQKCNTESRRKGMNLPHQIFECDESFNLEMQGPQGSVGQLAAEPQTEAAEIFIQDLLQPTTLDEVDLRNKEKRKSGRLTDMCSLYPPMDEEDAGYSRAIPQPPCCQWEQKLQFNFLELKFEIEIEPLFVTLALYDLKERRKISENFYLDLNSKEFRGIIQTHDDAPCTLR